MAQDSYPPRGSGGTSDHYPSGDIIGVKARRTASQELSSAVTTELAWSGSDVWDSDDFHDTSTNNTRITIPPGRDGKYSFATTAMFEHNTSGRRVLRILKNGTTVIGRMDTQAVTSSSGPTTLFAETQDDATAGDYYEVQAYQDSGGPLNISSSDDPGGLDPWFSAHKMAT